MAMEVHKVTKNHFLVASDNKSETSESFLFDFHREQTNGTHFTSETFD